ncbi:MAG: hypothetical protein IPL28_23835 [Chloroflexi bacterium]|nr:hypothetical protein [Chloroflexota bacterium]
MGAGVGNFPLALHMAGSYLCLCTATAARHPSRLCGALAVQPLAHRLLQELLPRGAC